MTATEDAIQTLISTLKALLERIGPLRRQVAALDTELAALQRDYEQKLAGPNAERDKLMGAQRTLQARLQARSRPAPEVTVQPVVSVAPVAPATTTTPAPDPEPPAPQLDPRLVRKRRLAEHIYELIAADQEEQVMQRVNPIVVDSSQDIGSILEILEWGTIWELPSRRETSEQQRERLAEWHEALEKRPAYWEGELRRLESDSRRDLLEDKRSLSRADWLAYLDELAREQATENDRLRHEVAVLEEQWKRQQEGEASDDRPARA
jgi:hypothetical protein